MDWNRFREEFAEWKEVYLSPFCLEQCTKTCCDLSQISIDLNEQELARLMGREPSNPLEFQTSPMHYTYKDICPQYNPEDRKCQIHENRPRACRNYPFHIKLSDIEFQSWLGVLPSCQYARTHLTELKDFAAQHGIVVVSFDRDR